MPWQEPTWQGESGGAFFVQEVFPENSSYWGAARPGNRGMTPVVMPDNPMYAILDLGCTRAMGSRKAISRFVKEAPNHGIQCEILPSSGTFNFANSQTSNVTEKCRVWFPTTPACSTDFDIVEEGDVPLLMSLTQMRNLQFSVSLTPTSAILQTPSTGKEGIPLEMSTSRHLVLDLRQLVQVHHPHGWEYPSFGVSKDAPTFWNAGESAYAEGADAASAAEHAWAGCPACEGKHRKHTCDRGVRQPVPVEEPPVEVPRPAEEPRPMPEVPGEDLRLEQEKQGMETPSQPLDSQGGALLPKPLLRLHQRLSKEVELYKLHVKHYHMSAAQFRKRTSELALPDDIFKKYEHVVKNVQGLHGCSSRTQQKPGDRFTGRAFR